MTRTTPMRTRRRPREVLLSSSLSLSTNIYGTFNFKKGRLKAIRHTIRPSVSFSYRPDFAERYNETIESNLEGTAFETYSPFDNAESCNSAMSFFATFMEAPLISSRENFTSSGLNNGAINVINGAYGPQPA